jgi:phosphoglycolate phosphatase-like HAD superfamily hydrolase
MIKGVIFDLDGTLTTENSVTFIMRWHMRRYFESNKYFNPFYGFLDLNRILFYTFRYMRHTRELFRKKNDKKIDEIIIQYGHFVSKYYPYILRSFKTLSKDDLVKISRQIPLRSGVKDILINLKQKDIKLGICSMSLEIAALSILYFIDIDFTACNNLIYKRDIFARVTGDSMLAIRDALDKKEVLYQFCKKFDISPEEVAYVGDDFHDFFAADAAGLGLILLDPSKINQNNYYFIKKAIDKYDFKLITSINSVLKEIKKINS